ncbi:ABC transporter permease [Timonella sp. A28]|uniref:ABC transporter permease n=1 Tax=Timonella sp. A28 TaxID=3442640 RepID=UPI003EB72F98
MSATTVLPQNSKSLEGALLPPVSWRGPITYAIIGLLCIVAFGLTTESTDKTTFLLSSGRDAVKLDPWMVSSRSVSLTIGAIILAIAGFAAWGAIRRYRFGAWLPSLVGVLAVFSFLVWSGAGKPESLPIPLLLSQGIIFAIPLAFGAMAGLINERVGVINIAIEGQLLAGAFIAAVVASLTGSPYVSLLFAPLMGALVGALLAFFAIKYKVNQIVVGVVLNVLVIGVTGYLFSTILKENKATMNTPPGLPDIKIPLLSDIPVVGSVLFDQNILVYLMFVAVIVLQFLLFRSKWGLRLRSVGEHPKAADTVGIKVNRTRWINVMIGGAVAGLGGAAFTVAAGIGFGKEMTSGKGYIALAAMILGRWNPNGALAAALLFGFAEALRGTLSIVGTPVPTQFLAMLPYLATIFAVAGLVGKVRPPAAEGVPYEK